MTHLLACIHWYPLQSWLKLFRGSPACRKEGNTHKTSSCICTEKLSTPNLDTLNHKGVFFLCVCCAYLCWTCNWQSLTFGWWMKRGMYNRLVVHQGLWAWWWWWWWIHSWSRQFRIHEMGTSSNYIRHVLWNKYKSLLIVLNETWLLLYPFPFNTNLTINS